MGNEREYFPECGEWSRQEREFANSVVQSIGMSAWHDLLRIQKTQGKDAFVRALSEIWPGGVPPDANF